jgi:flagellin
MDQLDDIAEDSGYKGINFLASDSLDVVFNADGSNKVTVSGFDGSASGLSIADASGSWALDGDINAAISNLDDAKDTLRAEAQELSNNLSVITTRDDFTEKMINTLEDGVANLTNANMEEESANMLMLQTRQQLGITSLSMASQAAQSILRLF